MTLAEIINVLRDEGHIAKANRVHYLIDNGLVSRPHKDGSGRFDYDLCHLEELRRYYHKHPPRVLK